MRMGFRIWSFGQFRIRGLELRASFSYKRKPFGVEALGFRVKGLGVLGSRGLGFRVVDLCLVFELFLS